MFEFYEKFRKRENRKIYRQMRKDRIRESKTSMKGSNPEERQKVVRKNGLKVKEDDLQASEVNAKVIMPEHLCG